MCRMVILLTATSSSGPPSTVSSASPRQLSKTQLLILIFLKPPLDSVPNLIRPVGPSGCNFEINTGSHVPSSNMPTIYPLTWQLVIGTFSVGLNIPSAKQLFRQMPSSYGELTVQLEIRTFLQQSMSIPSRLVSSLRLSSVKLSTPVARMAK